MLSQSRSAVQQQAAKLFQLHRRHLKVNYDLNSAFENTDKLLEQKPVRQSCQQYLNPSGETVPLNFEFNFEIKYCRVKATWFILRKCPAAFLFPSPHHVISQWISTSRCVCVKYAENRQNTCMNILNNSLSASFT